MAEATKIQWCDHTFNPWRGCTKVSAGCANCYAEAMARRNPGVLGVWGPEGTRVVASEAQWREPLKWDRAAARDGVRRRVFCASMADVFEYRPELGAARARLLELAAETRHLDWLLLTKRPEVASRWSGSIPPNAWVGTSVEDQEAAEVRIPHLLQIPAVVRFLSVEPLLGPVDLQPWLASGIHWVIVGGESGPKARECDVAWVESIVDQCRAAGVPVFVKQLGACPVATPVAGYTTGLAKLKDPKGGDPAEWPGRLRVREFPEVTVP